MRGYHLHRNEIICNIEFFREGLEGKSDHMKGAGILLALITVLAASGCGPDPARQTEVVVDRPVKLCPYHLPVCVSWSPAAESANSSAKPPVGAADRAWEKFQELLHFRPDNAAFRMMSGLLNTHFGNWQDLIVLEYIDRPAGAKIDDLNYGFVVLAHSGGYSAMTNFTQSDQFEFDLKAKPIQIDGELAEQCFTTLQAASQSLPSALVWQTNGDAPVLVVHYLTENGDSWACAVRDPAALPAILGQDTAILKKEASNFDVVDVLGKKNAAGKIIPDEFADAICGPADAARYEKVRNRYTTIVSGVWSISVARMKQEQPKQDDHRSGKPADVSRNVPPTRPVPPSAPGTPIVAAETSPASQPTTVSVEHPTPIESINPPATTLASQPAEIDSGVLANLKGLKRLLVLVESQSVSNHTERIQAGVTEAINKKLAGVCDSTVPYKKLKQFRNSTDDFNSLRIGQIGRKLSADAVIYVQLTDNKVETSQNLWQGRLNAEVKIVDSDGKRIWPAEPVSGREVEPVELSAADNSSAGYSEKFIDELTGKLAGNIIKLLTKSEPGE